MSDNGGPEQGQKHHAVERLHQVFVGGKGEIWKTLTDPQKEAVKLAADTITQLAELFEESQPLPRFEEARYVIFSRDTGSLILPVREGESAGIPYELTVRADRIEELALYTKRAQELLLRQGFKAKDTYYDERRAERQGDIPQPSQTHQKSQHTDDGQGGYPGGTNLLQKVVVTSPGKAEFHLDGLRFPLKDSRGAKMLVSLFDPDTGFSQSDFETEAVYTPANKWGNRPLKVTWIKKEQYRDVTRVHI